MRIAVTGASGNIGSALLRRLAAEGGHQVVGVVRRPPRGPTGPFADVQWASVDLTDSGDEDRLRAVVAGCDAVVHLAWGFQPSHRLAHLEELGVGGTRRVTEAVEAGGVPHLVHMSSVGAYSPKTDDCPVDESYPTGGVPSSPYSRHKSAAERILDDLEERRPELTVTRLRPGIVGQRSAGSALLRYAVPAVVPAGALRLLPVLPLDRALQIPVVHADDVADAIARVLHQRAGGPFNLASEPAVTVEHLAGVLGARHVQVPAKVVRGAVAAAWRARLEQVDPGWIDLAYTVPLLDTTRARGQLGWSPSVDAVTVLEEVVQGMSEAAHDATPVLRRRSVVRQLSDGVLEGPVSVRRRP
jgi:UDP-glucose 4-epimerase